VILHTFQRTVKEINISGLYKQPALYKVVTKHIHTSTF